MKTYDLAPDPQAVAQEQIAQKARLAELLMSGATAQTPVYSTRAGLARLLAGALAGHQMQGAQKEKMALAEQAKAQRSSEMDAIIQASESPDPNKRLALAKLLARSSDPGMQQAGLGMLMKGPGKVTWVDLGDKRVGTDETGRPIPGMELPKGVSPDTRFSKETVGADTRFTHTTPSAGALLTDERTRAEGAANRGVTVRGQNMSDTRAREALEQGAKPPAGYRQGANGNLEFIPGGPADPAVAQRKKEPTEGERISSGYYNRMAAAEKAMGPLEKDAGKPGVRESMMAAVPGVGEAAANALPGFMGGRSAGRQMYRQAQEDWVRAKLRKESGAVIAADEMDREIRTYFPQIGDTPQVIAQKRAARQIAAEGMKTAAGELAGGGGGGWSIKPIGQ